MNRRIILIAHNLRSCHNVGSLLRTAEGLGIAKVYLSGYTPFPKKAGDSRLPHLANKIDRQIHKTALGAEQLINWEHIEDTDSLLDALRKKGFAITALEQGPSTKPLPQFKTPDRVVLIVGNEVSGIEADVLASVDHVLEIPMLGKKESFNVVQAAAMALYHMRFRQ